ncbi:hypothetical protein GGS20DRAFT_590420 [Poronia punctata]|nr:hypothetical protein GGS20DRAFT_590420 [Poronia punctata]
MVAPPKYDDLALKYVLAEQDEKDKLREISQQAAKAIQDSTNRRLAIGQWVASVSRWMQSTGDEDLISRARALEFLASTLEVLSNREDTLNADQVKLLIAFFGSLFENDHKAGVTASAKALRYLVGMKYFQPTLGRNIIQSVCKLGDDFKLQPPSTRLELYTLLRGLLQDPAVASNISAQQDGNAGFALDMLSLCRNERDPENLMVWFEILKAVLQDFDPPEKVTSEIFKAFSAYFPISLRPTATPSAVTTDDLKVALRSCFSAHHRVANLAIPFLVDKLDKGDQTVAVKVDILLTLDACLTGYADPERSVEPYADQIWGSLKYEVRNGEIQDIIKATLKVLCSLTKRLGGEKSRSFLDNAWIDLKEDISDSKYTSQAGRLLIAIVGATPASFSSLVPRAIEHIKKNIKQTSSVLHKRHLMAMLSSILKLRLHLVSDLAFNSSPTGGRVPLSDELFGDSLFRDLYLPFWEEHANVSSPIEHIAILRETMQGLGALVGQKSSQGDSLRLCSDTNCETIFSLLAKPVIVSPLEGPKYFDSVEERVPQDLLDAGREALINAVPLYPPSFRYLLLQYLASIKAAQNLQQQPYDLASHIRSVSTTLCAIVQADTLSPTDRWLHETALINAFLQGLQWMLSERTDPVVLSVFIDAIHEVVKSALNGQEVSNSDPCITGEWYHDFITHLDATDAPRIDLDRQGTIEVSNDEDSEDDKGRSKRAYSIFVVQQIYRRFTVVANPSTTSDGKALPNTYAVGLGRELAGGQPDLVLREDLLLNRIGNLATAVIRILSGDEQESLALDTEVFNLFHSATTKEAGSVGKPAALSTLNDFRTSSLSLGLMQGLRPSALRPQVLLTALHDLVHALVENRVSCSDTTRAVLDTLLTVASNKFCVQNYHELQGELRLVQEPLVAKLNQLFGINQIPESTKLTLQTFRSILHYLAGIVPLLPRPRERCELLNLIVDRAPTNITMGREFAQNLGLLVAPRECLSERNHAGRKKLNKQWLYYNIVSPYLGRCFPGPDVNGQESVNRAVATFSILRYLDYERYTEDVATIVRIGIRSLSTFKIGTETEVLLTVLFQIVENDPSQLEEHLPGLIQGLIAIYGMARNAKPNVGGESGNGSKAKGRDHLATRMYTLQFFQQLTRSGYKTHLLLPHRTGLLRPLAAACGDSVREIRRTALEARKAWVELN